MEYRHFHLADVVALYGDFEVVSRTLDDNYWMVAYEVDDGPVRYYRYDREENQAEFLFTHKKALEDLQLAEMHPVVIKSRDGLDLVSYYTLPVGSDSDSNGRPDEPLSTVDRGDATNGNITHGLSGWLTAAMLF